MGLRYPQPDNEDAFEQMCLRFYRKHWRNESLALYAKRGEKQDGIDIHDPACLKPIRAVQCKHHEPTKTLPTAKIKEEVAKAEKSAIPLDTYVIATTAKKTRQAQDTVVALNSRPEGEKKFTVVIHFWEDISELLGQLNQVQVHFIIAGNDLKEAFVASMLHDPEVRSLATHVLAVGNGEIAIGVFADIEQLLTERNFDAVRHELGKLPSKSEDLKKLPASDQYKVLRFRGKYALETGDYAAASKCFLEAYELQPDLDQAKQNQVLAYGLIPDRERAFSLATQYAAAGLTTPYILCRLVDNAATLKHIRENDELFSAHLTTSLELNIALSHALRGFGDLAGAADAAERAIAIDPQSAHANMCVGMTEHNAADSGTWKIRSAHLRKAILHYDAALKDSLSKKYVGLIPEIYVNRAAVHAQLGDSTAAAKDYRAAAEVVGKPSPYAARAVSYFLHEEEFASAWELLELVDKESAKGEFFTLMTEFHSSVDIAERRGFLEEMKKLAERDWKRAIECRFHCVQWSLLLKDSAFAASCITEKFQKDFPFQAYTALAWIALESGDKEAAIAHAGKAVEQGIPDAHPQEFRLLARVLTKTGRHAQALDYLEKIAVPGLLNEHMKELIHCAQDLGRDDLLLRLCRELRETGQQDDLLRRLEIRLLDRYAPEQGLAIVDELIQSSPTAPYFVAYKNLLATRLGRKDLLEFDPSKLPTADLLSPREARLVVIPYMSARKYDDALTFLHGQLRHYFDDEYAHGQFVFHFLTHAEKTSLGKPPAKIRTNCAVAIQVGDRAPRWVIIENNRPAVSRGELSESNELSKRLLDREIGDVIEMPGAMVAVETATIRAIQTKYLRAFQDCWEHFRARFPESSVVQEMDLGSGDQFDPTPMIESLKERRKYVQECVSVYRDNPCSLYLFSSKVGLTELDGIKALAGYPNAPVKCSHTTASDFDLAAEQGIDNETIVLDMSALCTLTLADAWKHLAPGKRYVVSQATKERLDEWLREASDEKPNEGGYAAVTDDGQLYIHETTPEQREARRAEREALKLMVEKHCTWKSSPAVASLSPKKRALYEKVVGFHNIEAICLAKDLGAVLWSDDHFNSLVAAADFGVRGVWTQLALKIFVAAANVSENDYHLVSAKLAAWKYGVITWNAFTIIRAGEFSQWDTETWPFKQCIALLSNSSLTLRLRADIALQSLKALRRSSCNELRQSAVIQALLTAIGDRRAVAWMHDRLDHVFALDFTSVRFLRPELVYWLNSHVV